LSPDEASFYINPDKGTETAAVAPFGGGGVNRNLIVEKTDFILPALEIILTKKRVLCVFFDTGQTGILFERV
jgi:hypothetical protein